MREELHIRKEWQFFIKWNYKRVATNCGIKTVAAKSGIPGIDEAKWCPRCALVTFRQIERVEQERLGGGLDIDERVGELYNAAWIALYGQVEANQASARKKIEERRRQRPEDYGKFTENLLKE